MEGAQLNSGRIRPALLLDSGFSCVEIVFVACYVVLVAVACRKSSIRWTLPKQFGDICTGILAAIAGALHFFLVLISALDSNVKRETQWWISTSVRGLTWLLLASTTVLMISKRFLRVWCMANFVIVTVHAISGILEFKNREQAGFWKLVLDVASWPISLSLMVIAFYKKEKRDVDIHERLLNEDDATGDCTSSVQASRGVCAISGAGWISRHYFLWLNPLLALGKRKNLEEEDMPRVAPEDQAEVAYECFTSTWSSQKSLFWTLAHCYWRSFLHNAVYALIKSITLSAGPLVLKTFVSSTSKESQVSYIGYILVLILFLGKALESIAQRQWLFGSKRLGMRMRSAVMAALCSKQLRLSSLARRTHATGEVMSYMAVDAYRIGEFGYWVQLLWTPPLQIAIAGGILIRSVGVLPAAAGLGVIGLSMLANRPMASMQRKFQNGLMSAQDQRMRATSAVLKNMKVVKLQAWEEMFKKKIEELRDEEMVWLSKVQYRKTYNAFIFWLLPVLVSTTTFFVCWLMGFPLDASNVFTTLATFRIIQEPIRLVPDVIAATVQAKVSLARISKYLQDDELDSRTVDRSLNNDGLLIDIQEASLSWDPDEVQNQFVTPTLRNINLIVKRGSRVAVCGEVGSGKSTLLLSMLGEVPKLNGKIRVCGNIAYVAQAAWIQSGTIRDNILFGLDMDNDRYVVCLKACALDKDLESFPFGDFTEIGERGLNLSGGQKQRIQLARALYQDADVYLLDDPFSAVDAETGSMLFKKCILGVLSKKTVVLVTHQVEFLQNFDTILLMQDGEICQSGTYRELLVYGSAFEGLVKAHKEVMSTLDETAGAARVLGRSTSIRSHIDDGSAPEALKFNQLVRQEKKEFGDTGVKPYMDYMKQANGFFYFTLAIMAHIVFLAGQMTSNWWMAAEIGETNTSKLIGVYCTIGLSTGSFLFIRSILVVMMGLAASKSFFRSMITSLFSAPMSFFDSTPSGRILSRLSVDLSIVDLDIPFSFAFSFAAFLNALTNLTMTSSVVWEILVIVLPMMYLNRVLQVYYLASARELMRINGTTKAPILNLFGEAISGVTTIRAFGKQKQFMNKFIELIDTNSSPFFHNFAAREWLIQRLECIWSTVLCCSALILVLLPPGTIAPGFVGLVLSYGLSLNGSQIGSVQNQCNLANMIISVERIKQYLSLPCEQLFEEKARPPPNWPSEGKIELQNLQIRYSPDAPLVLRGITCTFEGGQKVGVVGRTGSGKTTLISALFRLVDPAAGRILIDTIDITTIGLTDLRSKLSIIPQEPTLFRGTVRFNLDPLSLYTDVEIWEALEKCQLAENVKEKASQLESSVGDDGENWSVGERQLFCLGRALLKSSQILVLDEATASIDNATDAVIQKVLSYEFKECTTITVAHRIPTVVNSDMVLALEDGLLVEFDHPAKLLENKSSLFSRLVAEYWSNTIGHSKALRIN